MKNSNKPEAGTQRKQERKKKKNSAAVENVFIL